MLFQLMIIHSEKKKMNLKKLSKLVLDVFGASGAIWGTSEVLTLRNEETQELWRKISIGVGGFFLIRYTFIFQT